MLKGSRLLYKIEARWCCSEKGHVLARLPLAPAWRWTSRRFHTSPVAASNITARPSAYLYHRFRSTVRLYTLHHTSSIPRNPTIHQTAYPWATRGIHRAACPPNIQAEMSDVQLYVYDLSQVGIQNLTYANFLTLVGSCAKHVASVSGYSDRRRLPHFHRHREHRVLLWPGCAVMSRR
jgi:hypothetical protein